MGGSSSEGSGEDGQGGTLDGQEGSSGGLSAFPVAHV